MGAILGGIVLLATWLFSRSKHERSSAAGPSS